MAIRDLLRRSAERLARALRHDDLFEQPGERPPASPIAGHGAPSVGRAPGAAERIVTPRTARTGNDAPAAAPVADAPVAAPVAPVAPVDAPVSPRKARAARAAPAGPVTAAASFARPREGCVPVDLAQLLGALTPGGRPLVVNHWATWCEPCVDELPRLVRAAAGCGDLAEFLGVSWDLFDHPGEPGARAKEVAAFAESMGVGYASVLYTGTPEDLFAACGLEVHLVPQTLVLAPDGRVTWHKAGILEHDDVFPLIAAVKAAQARPT
jgi:hypothetical protein